MRLRNPWLWLAAAWFLAGAMYANAQVPTASICETFFGGNGGSGVVVGHKETHTYVMTCRHILELPPEARGRPATASVKFSNGQRLTAQLQRPKGFPDDLMMFVTERVQIDAVPVAADARGGEPVWKAGFPATAQGTSPLNIQQGTWRGSGLFDCYVWSGDSGGGVFNAQGELLGIISGYDTQHSKCSSLSSTRKFVSYWSNIFTDVKTQYCYPGGNCQPPQISYGGYVRPSYPSPTQPVQPPAPKPTTPTQPKPADPCEDLRSQFAEIKLRNEQTLQSLNEIKVQIESGVGKEGPPGPPGESIQGPPGKRGERGFRGKDAAPVDLDEIVAKIQPAIIRWYDPRTGETVQEAEIRFGKTTDVAMLPFRMIRQDPYTKEKVADELVYLGDAVLLDEAISTDQQ